MNRKVTKVTPLFNKLDIGIEDFIELEHNSVVLTNPEHQRAFNSFRLTHASVLFHIAVLVLITPVNVYMAYGAFSRGSSAGVIVETIVRFFAVTNYVLYSLHFFVQKKNFRWFEWVGGLTTNIICDVGMLLVMSVSCVQILTIVIHPNVDKDVAVLFFFAVAFQVAIVRQIYPAADWWAGPVVCVIGCVLSCVLAARFHFSSHLILLMIFLYAVSFFADCENYERDLHNFINHTNLGRVIKVAIENEQKQKQAEVASKEMRSFIGNIAHDLKTPLQSFVSEIALLTESHTEESKKSSVSALESLCTFMLMTINRSLDFVKSESGVSLVPSNSTVNLKESLDWVVMCVKRTSHAVPVIRGELPKHVCDFIITDKEWLEENLLCLVSNSTKFTTAGSITITTSLVTGEPIGVDVEINTSVPTTLRGGVDIELQLQRSGPVSTEMLLFEIEDTGIGLTQKQMDSLFQPFKQAQRKAGGTGLGLYALAKRVHAIGGQFGVRGRRDGCRGCLFWFSIPYRPDFASSHLSSEECVGAHSVDNRVYSSNTTGDITVGSMESNEELSLRVLLVDDSPLIQKTTSRILRKANHTVTIAQHGMQCLEILADREDDFDVILMDIQMPVMDGIETIHRIREKEAAGSGDAKGGRRQFVIGLSANSDSETRESAIEAGMDDFIPKPLRTAVLDQVYRHWHA